MNEKFLSKKYKVKREIASGGMGTIYLATDTKLDRDVAIKILHPQYSGEPAFAQRFLREAWAMAKLDHPNIIRIWSVEEEEDSHCIVMEYFPGNDLKHIIRSQGPLPVAEAISIATQIIQGLAYAHYMGIIHRDIKPANILVDQEGKVKITDFGIAAAFSESSLTIDGTVMGTPEYMAPEQARAEPVGSHTDLYSIGILMYELVTGQTPYKGIPAQSLVAKLAFGSDNPVLSFPPHIPGELQDLIIKLTQKRVEDRLKDINEILTILKATAALSHELQPATEETDETAPFPFETAATRNIASSTQTIPQAQSFPTKIQPDSRAKDSSKKTKPSVAGGPYPKKPPQAPAQNRKILWGAIGIVALITVATLVVSQWAGEDFRPSPSLSTGKVSGQPDKPDSVETTIGNIQQISQNIQTTQEEIQKEIEGFSLAIDSLHEEILNKNIRAKTSGAQDWLKATEEKISALALNKKELEKSQQLIVNKSKKVFTSSMQQGEQLFQQDISEDQKKQLYEATANLKTTQQALETTFTNHLQHSKKLLLKLEGAFQKSERAFLANTKKPSGKPTPSPSTPTTATQIENLKKDSAKISAKIQKFLSHTSTQHDQLTQQVAQYATQISSLKSSSQTGALTKTVGTIQNSLETLKKTISKNSSKHDQELQAFSLRHVEILNKLNTLTQEPLPPPLKKQVSHILNTLKSGQKDLKNFKHMNWKELNGRMDTVILKLHKTHKTLKKEKAAPPPPGQPSIAKIQPPNESHALQKILDDFEAAYENRDLLNITLTTSMSDARSRNLELMFKAYSVIETHTEIVSTTESQVKAKIIIDKLISKEGKLITPNFIIRETAITIPKKNGEWGKIQW